MIDDKRDLIIKDEYEMIKVVERLSGSQPGV